MAVQLPDFTALGVVNPRPGTVQPAYPQEDPAAIAQAQFGAGLLKAGGALTDIAAYDKMNQVKMDRAMANAAFLGQSIPITEQLKEETDPDKILQLRAQYKAAHDQAAGAIGDPDARQLWLAQNSEHVARGEAVADARYRRIYLDRYVGNVDEQGANLVRQAAVSPEALPTALKDLGNLYDAARDSGAMSADTAFQRRKQAEKQLIVGAADNLINQGRPDQAISLIEQHRDNLDPIAVEALRQKAETKGSAIRVDGAVNRALGRTLEPVSGDLSDRIIGAESGGRDVKNLLSSASGPGQFIDSTWLSMIKSSAPDIAEGKSDAQLLALKGDKPLAKKMVSAYAEQNKQFLASQGLPTDDGALYLAHFLGPAGAAKVLSASPATPMREIVPADVLRANPNIAGKTAGDVRDLTASRVGAAVPQIPNRSGLPLPSEVAQAIMSDPTLRNDQERYQALQRYETRYKAEEATQAQLERIKAAREKQALEARITQIQKDAYSDNPTITARDIVNDPLFDGDPKLREHMIGFINNPPGSGVPAPQSYAAALNLVRRIDLPWGDQSKITDMSQISDPAVMRMLNKSDYEFVAKHLNDVRTPEGEAFNTVKSEFVKRYAPFINKSNPLTGERDPVGEAREFEFERYIAGKAAEYRKANKNPNALFDPKNPDFLGSPTVLQMFQPTLEQAIQSKSDWAQGVPQPLRPIGYPEPPPTPTGADMQRLFPPVARTLTTRQPGTRQIPGGVEVPIPPPEPERGAGFIEPLPPRAAGETPAEYLARIGQQPQLEPRAPMAR